MSSTRVLLTPFYIEVDDAVAEVLEVLEHKIAGEVIGYTVSLRIIYKGMKSRVFPLDCKNMNDLLNKLRIEVTKLKFFEMALGQAELRRLMTG
ncbi:MAG: hypothetical protein QXI27_04235 [Nitrososphaerota archaeon]